VSNPCDRIQSTADLLSPGPGGGGERTAAGHAAGRSGVHPRLALAPPASLGKAPPPTAEVVTTRRAHRVEHELVLARGATAEDVTTAMIMIAPSATLVDHRVGCRSEADAANSADAADAADSADAADAAVSLVFREL